MSNHQHEEGGVVKSFTLTAFLSFVIIFCLFLLLSNCHGTYTGNSKEAKPTTEQKEAGTEHH